MAEEINAFRTFTNHKGEEEVFTVFLIHGHSDEFEKVDQYIREQLHFKTVVSVKDYKGGIILHKIKRAIWDECDCAVALLSPDDKLNEERSRARQNVIFEIGYCQGFWDYYYWEDEELEPVILIKEKSVEINSDLNGVEFIQYEAGKIRTIYKSLSLALENIYNFLDESNERKLPIKDKTASNDLRLIQNYMKDRKLSFISFEKMEENIHPKFSEEYVMRLIEKFPDKIRRGKIKNGKLGIKLIS